MVLKMCVSVEAAALHVVRPTLVLIKRVCCNILPDEVHTIYVELASVVQH